MKIWGYWATLGWACLALFVGQFAGLAALLLWRTSDVSSLLTTPFDGVTVTLFIVISNPIMIAVIALAVRLLRARQAEYLALTLPAAGYLRLALIGLVGLIAITDASLYVSGYPLVTAFQLQSYTTAAAEGWLPAMLVGAIIMAPAGEEIMFRAFLFRGWVRSDRAAWPARPIRLDRCSADFRYWALPRLDALAQRIDVADIRAARFVQCRRHPRNRASTPLFFVARSDHAGRGRGRPITGPVKRAMVATTSSKRAGLPGVSLTIVATTFMSRRNSESIAVSVWVTVAG
jgi:membrane protease YdiL (CAAX protease family)